MQQLLLPRTNKAILLLPFNCPPTIPSLLPSSISSTINKELSLPLLSINNSSITPPNSPRLWAGVQMPWPCGWSPWSSKNPTLDCPPFGTWSLLKMLLETNDWYPLRRCKLLRGEFCQNSPSLISCCMIPTVRMVLWGKRCPSLPLLIQNIEAVWTITGTRTKRRRVKSLHNWAIDHSYISLSLIEWKYICTIIILIQIVLIITIDMFI